MCYFLLSPQLFSLKVLVPKFQFLDRILNFFLFQSRLACFRHTLPAVPSGDRLLSLLLLSLSPAFFGSRTLLAIGELSSESLRAPAGQRRQPWPAQPFSPTVISFKKKKKNEHKEQNGKKGKKNKKVRIVNPYMMITLFCIPIWFVRLRRKSVLRLVNSDEGVDHITDLHCLQLPLLVVFI